MRTKQRNLLFYLSLALLVAVLFGYNIWSYFAGHCTAESLMSLSMPAKLLLGGVAAAVVVLLWLRRRNHDLRRTEKCVCCGDLLPQWGYCPHCGKRHHH